MYIGEKREEKRKENDLSALIAICEQMASKVHTLKLG